MTITIITFSRAAFSIMILNDIQHDNATNHIDTDNKTPIIVTLNILTRSIITLSPQTPSIHAEL
jgi:hypothetical protein